MQLLQNGDSVELFDMQSENTVYKIPNYSLAAESNDLKPQSECIQNLGRKSFIDENNKWCLYELAIIIEDKYPLRFDWPNTFYWVEHCLLNNAVSNQQDKTKTGQLNVVAFRDFLDESRQSNSETKLILLDAVDENLTKYKLPR